MFGDLATTSLARDVLEQFLADGIVTCEDNKPSDGSATSLALTAAYDDAVTHSCNAPPDKSTPEPKTRYRWGWPKLPSTPIDENELVVFLNSIADSALSTARSIRKDDSLQAKNRFAPVDKNRVIALSYWIDGEYTCPDFVVLPLAAFSDDKELGVEDAYVNFTAMLLAGESKSVRSTRDGLIQVQRYMRGIKRAQPWLRFAVGMTVGKDFVALSRGDRSGLERFEISLTDGRGCIQFIRTILGIVLADKEAFGHNPEVGIEERDVSLVAPELHPAATLHTGTNTTTSVAASAIPLTFSGRRSSRLRNPTSASSNLPSVNQPSATSSTGTTSDNTATRSKRGPDDEMSPGKWSKKQKRTVVFRAFVPVRAYGRKHIATLFTSACIRGRGTTVYVVGADGGKTYSALKTAWQDVACAGAQAAVLEKLSGPEPHLNVVIPMRLLDPLAEDPKVNSRLGSIRGFLGDEMQKPPVENRILTVTTSDPQRPVAYFWSPHDFVRGVIGALLGHEYLCEIGILHRDISENNIVLSPRRGGLGVLIGFDMAVVGSPNMHRDFAPPTKKSVEEILASFSKPHVPSLASDEQYKAQRTATYMSIGVLRGEPHTHFHDIESFLYVLILFFFSYKGPLAEDKLRSARARGFTQPVGAGWLPHVTAWPPVFQRWASGSLWEILVHKHYVSDPSSSADFVEDCAPYLQSRWETASQSIPQSLTHLIFRCWTMFSLQRRQVTHRQFIGVLETWLKQYAGEEGNYIYPFDD
ncbi:hypothetical protein EDD15DRAFT_2433137 [Pisolithus albus]|nr:hypothetical protein EDD15DRAFT_2433137 [Pisolithus albus]